MNNTNRGLNRTAIFLFGLVLIIVGAGVALVASIPDWFDAWKSAAASVKEGTPDVVSATTVSSAGQSWILILIPVICLALIVLLVLFIIRQGRGSTRVLLTEKSVQAGSAGRRSAAQASTAQASTAQGSTAQGSTAQGSTAQGSITIDGKVAEQAIQAALKNHPGIMSSNVSTYLVGRTPALSVTANVRRGESPQVVRSFVDDVVAAWDGAFGREVPVLIQINAGLAARMAKATRVSASSVAESETSISANA
ncbi:hypothetical protein B0I08_11275 [Glaciihabitans tibetensis]|uniref:Uncharacterized protein n=1 Tax=Glaciihabitans tibetensis TaxID=1266600 RepID=A0A2T0V3E8_9MICO|nr:hypothetical protein [Glaciihabitans tibetensis]PRY64690.1 hypothetical protein B0I08_11275 [Glaciihabitans tibetensis]